MSLTEALARPVLKRRFDNGAMPLEIMEQYPALAAITNNTDLDGDDFQQALQNGTPQAAGASFQAAANNIEPGVYNRFLVTRVTHYSLARIQGPVLDAAAKKGSGAFVDLLKSETDGAALTEMKCEETYVFGDGTAVLGQISAASNVATATVSLTTGEDIVKFDLGMKLDGYTTNVLATMLTPLTVIGSNKVIGISRNPDNPTLTFAAAWNTVLSGIAVLHYLTRAGDGPSAGASRIITGTAEWVAGGTNPSTLFSCVRNTDPVNLAGQTKNYSTFGMEEALNDAESLLGLQGRMASGRICFINPRTYRNFKNTAAGKVIYDRLKSPNAELGFRVASYDGDYGPVRFIRSPLFPVGTFLLGTLEDLVFETMGPMPKLITRNGKLLDVANDDAVEIRFGMYGFFRVRRPGAFVRGTAFGAN